MDDDFAFLSFVALVVDDDELFSELEEEDKRTHKCWVPPWGIGIHVTLRTHY